MPGVSYVALTRVVSHEGVEYSEGIVVPSGAMPDGVTAWAAARAMAVDHWRSTLRPPGSHQTEAERIAELLREIGWERAKGRHRSSRGIPLQRVEARFHTGLATQGSQSTVMIMNLEGDIVDSVPADERPDRILAAHGWHSLGQAEGWQPGTLRVSAFDWPQILQRLGRGRDEAQASAAEADRRLRVAIREALLSGLPARNIAEQTNLSRPRIYQIRDKRR